MDIRPLTDQDLDSVFTAFLEAFGDYLVKMNPSYEQFAEMLTRRGYVAEASAGIFQNGELVAFALNGIEGTRAYNTGTGVVPSLRKLGLGRKVLELSYSLLRERGCTQYQLEVIEANKPAFALYLASGFKETRRLQCWALESAGRIPRVKSSAAMHNWETRQRWWTADPSWQNSTASILRARERFVVLGDDQAYAILFPTNGDLPQLAVHPERRRKRIGTHLLQAALTLSGKPLRIMNVDDGDEGLGRFLEAAGAIRTVRQIEMQLRL
jgi:ribosomal protein S18 acetylase RimI-like enzyme